MKKTGNLIGLLQDIQKEYGFLPGEALDRLSADHRIPVSEIYSVATFYNAFSLVPKGEHHVAVCMGTACHVRGAQGILDKLVRELGIETGETTEDMKFSLDAVACLGACALGPIVTVGEDYHGQMNLRKVDKVLKNYRGGGKQTPDEGDEEEED